MNKFKQLVSMLTLCSTIFAGNAFATDYQTSFTGKNYAGVSWKISTTNNASGVIERSDNGGDTCGAPVFKAFPGICNWNSTDLNQQYIYVIPQGNNILSAKYYKVPNVTTDSGKKYLVCEDKSYNRGGTVTDIKCEFNSTGDSF